MAIDPMNVALSPAVIVAIYFMTIFCALYASSLSFLFSVRSLSMSALSAACWLTPAASSAC